MNEWMNEFLEKEHTGHPRTCRNEESTPRVQHSARAALMLVHCQRTAWTRPLLPQRSQRRGGEAASCGLARALLLLTQPCQGWDHRGTRDPQSTSGQQTQLPSLTSWTSCCSFLFTSSDLRRSFLAVSRSSFSSVTWAKRAARRSSIWLCSCLSMTSWRLITLARSSSWLRGSLRGKGSLRQPCFEREGPQHFRAIGEVKTAFCALGAHKTLTATQTYMVCWWEVPTAPHRLDGKTRTRQRVRPRTCLSIGAWHVFLLMIYI